ncbi:hypothetical protein NDU88_004200 [Pleurodeles waltl]|uniref:Uncharacterized protein n=1 Tax=Pleurodeles waltl TaxID=8319 RepID=A0AAV7WTF2_PLEWA|nr:hypothetical protein NDU88_004200 [Pleurodeles waltl]
MRQQSTPISQSNLNTQGSNERLDMGFEVATGIMEDSWLQSLSITNNKDLGEALDLKTLDLMNPKDQYLNKPLLRYCRKLKQAKIDEATFNTTNHDSGDIVRLQKPPGLAASSPTKKEANTQGIYSISADESSQLKEIVATNSECTNERSARKPKPLAKRPKKRASKARKQTCAKAANDNLYPLFSVFQKPQSQDSGSSGNQKAPNYGKATRDGAVNGLGPSPTAASRKSAVHKMSQSTVQFQSKPHTLELRVREVLDQAPRQRCPKEKTHMSSEKSPNQPDALIPRKDQPWSITAGILRPKDVPHAAASAATLFGRNKKQLVPQVSPCQATTSHAAATQFAATSPGTTEGIMSSLKLDPWKGSCTQDGATQAIEISPDTMSGNRPNYKLLSRKSTDEAKAQSISQTQTLTLSIRLAIRH